MTLLCYYNKPAFASNGIERVMRNRRDAKGGRAELGNPGGLPTYTNGCSY